MTKEKNKVKQLPPAFTSDGRETQLINLAMKQAEKQLREGTASSQVLTFFLKLGVSLANLERERLESQVVLAKAKADALNSQRNSEELYQEALRAFREYHGDEEDEG